MAMIPGLGYDTGTSMLTMAINNQKNMRGGSMPTMTDFMQDRTESALELSQLRSMAKGSSAATSKGKSDAPGSVEVTSFPNMGYGQGNMKKLPKYTESSVQFDYLTKSTPEMTDKEFEEAIKKLAEKNAAEGKYEEVGDDYFELARKYVSVVSPDRKAIIAGASPTSLVPGSVNTDLAKAYDDKGRLVATYNPTKGWNNKFTPEEKARNEKFDEIYWNAYNAYVKANNLDVDGKDKESAPSDAVVNDDSDAKPSVDVSA